MNIIEAMRIWKDDLRYGTGVGEGYAEAAMMIDDTVFLYDKLAPDWNEAPDWAQWYAIDANGISYWYEHEPVFQEGDAWIELDSETLIISFIRIPLGIDWRLCKWQRP